MYLWHWDYDPTIDQYDLATGAKKKKKNASDPLAFGRSSRSSDERLALRHTICIHMVPFGCPFSMDVFSVATLLDRLKGCKALYWLRTRRETQEVHRFCDQKPSGY